MLSDTNAGLRKINQLRTIFTDLVSTGISYIIRGSLFTNYPF